MQFQETLSSAPPKQNLEKEKENWRFQNAQSQNLYNYNNQNSVVVA